MSVNLIWRRRLFVLEEALQNVFLQKLNSVYISEELNRWGPKNGGEFTVKSTYGLVVTITTTAGRVSPEEESIFRLIWKSKAPSKVMAFT
ncbi:putative ribonuclease H protein [Trifolium medium]|uniref:Putative ribonuclease H protein n=1 Tax=Trifolium medium TaxID=97028 RepID=A0A392N475_9FABA|nr:putative ribonuclease H protein [Trifolium medium]